MMEPSFSICLDYFMESMACFSVCFDACRGKFIWPFCSFLNSIAYSATRFCRYPKREIHNLARFISVAKFRPLSWRTSHPYVLADRFEDVTPPEIVQADKKCDRNVTIYGYLRGCNMKKGIQVVVMEPLPLIPLKKMKSSIKR